MCRGVGGDTCGESAQSASMLVDGPRLRWCGTDETADAPSRFEDSGAFEVGVDAGDGVRIHPKLHRQLSDGGQLITGGEPSRGNGRAQRAIELRINRRRVPRVERDDSHCSLILVY